MLNRRCIILLNINKPQPVSACQKISSRVYLRGPRCLAQAPVGCAARRRITPIILVRPPPASTHPATVSPRRLIFSLPKERSHEVLRGRKLPSRWWLFNLAAVASLAMAETPVKPPASPVPAIYAKRATWAQTMLATRAAYLRWQAEQAQRPVNADLKPFASGLISGAAEAEHISINVSGADSLRLITRCEQGSGNLHIWGEARLIAHGGRETRLSSLTPAVVSVGWGQLCLNQNWQRQPLAIGDRQFSHGLWVHANSDLGYVLNKKYERFEAWIGMDKARATGGAVPSDVRSARPASGRLAADRPGLPHGKWVADPGVEPGTPSGLVPPRSRAGFAAGDTACEEDLVGRVVRQLGAAGGACSRS